MDFGPPEQPEPKKASGGEVMRVRHRNKKIPGMDLARYSTLPTIKEDKQVRQHFLVAIDTLLSLSPPDLYFNK